MAQLDIFGNAIPDTLRLRRKAGTWQPSLIPPEVESRANAEEMARTLEAFRAASGNDGGPNPVGCETCDGFGFIDTDGNDCPDCHGLGYREDAPDA